MGDLILPFKPFTLDEVSAATGITTKLLDLWTRSILPLKRGEDGTLGLDAMQAFGIYVGWRFLQEGADHDKAASTALYVGTLPEKTLKDNLDMGFDFPVVRGGRGTLVPSSLMPNLGKRLGLSKLLGEFKGRLAEVFPNG